MNMYEQYIKERENLDVIKTDKGFIIYKMEFPNCIINDCFVLPEYRQEKHATFLANQIFEICKSAGVKAVYCFTDDNANGVDLSKFAIERFGFEFDLKEGARSRYKLEVSEWERL